MKTFYQIREGFVSAAQRKAVWASKADGGKGHPDNKKEDSDAVKAFLAKGGKIKKLPPAKAQGYHGKDDPGKGMHGMMDKPDTKAMGTRKKVKSMEATQVDEISKDTKKSYIKKAADDMSKQADKMARAQRGDGKMDKAVNKFVNRRKGIARAVESVEEAKRTVTIDKPDRLTSLRVSKDKPPFDNAKPMNKDPKDKFGNPIKNRAKHLARAAARKAVGLKDNYQVQQYKDGKKTGPAKSFGGNLKKATAHASKMGGDHRVHKAK